MPLWQRLKTECEANRGKAGVLAALVVALLVVIGRPLVGGGAVPDLIAPLLPPATPTPAAAEGRPQLWTTVSERLTRLHPVGRTEAVRDAFRIDPDQFPILVPMADDASAPVVAAPDRVELDEEPDNPNAPALELQATSAGRLAVIDGRVVRRGRTFAAGEGRFMLVEVGQGWIRILDEAGHPFRYVVRSVHQSRQAADRRARAASEAAGRDGSALAR